MQFFKDKIGSTGVSFLQETHSDRKTVQKWKEDLKDQVFFLMESQSLVPFQLLTLEQKRLPLKNANTEKKQIGVFSILFELLSLI